MFVPFSRVMTMLMAAVVCFGVIVPAALHRGQAVLAFAIVAAFAAYVIANVLLWLRLRARR